MNTKLLRRIQKQILKEPRQFQMMWYFDSGKIMGKKIPNCGTAACIGGWAVSLGRHIKPSVAHKKSWNVKQEARQLLEADSYEADRLFRVSHWPKQFALHYKAARTLLKRAEIAVARIDHFIATKGAE